MRSLLFAALLAACAGSGYRDPEDSETMAHVILDRNVATRVRMALARDPMTAPYEGIAVRCEAGVVTLEGGVDRGAVKSRAMEIARRCEGVRSVEDRLTIARR
ncbi:MAG: BON domain-containing protein [Planctomycetota bacterium]